MSIFKRPEERTVDQKASEALSKKRDELLKKMASVQAAWEKEDFGPVREAALELAASERMENLNRVQKARQDLRLAIFKRDEARSKLNAEIQTINQQIENLNSPVIFSKVHEWQTEMSELRNRKIVEHTGFVSNPEGNRKVKYRSNLPAIDNAKEKLSTAISKLRGMTDQPLDVLLGFIQTTEAELKAIDLTILTDAQPVDEMRYIEISSMPGTKNFQTGRIVGNQIVKDLDSVGHKQI